MAPASQRALAECWYRPESATHVPVVCVGPRTHTLTRVTSCGWRHTAKARHLAGVFIGLILRLRLDKLSEVASLATRRLVDVLFKQGIFFLTHGQLRDFCPKRYASNITLSLHQPCSAAQSPPARSNLPAWPGTWPGCDARWP